MLEEKLCVSEQDCLLPAGLWRPVCGSQFVAGRFVAAGLWPIKGRGNLEALRADHKSDIGLAFAVVIFIIVKL
jgi:hypothetical protein